MSGFDPRRLPADAKPGVGAVEIAVGATDQGREMVEVVFKYGRGQSISLMMNPADAADVGWKLVAAGEGLPLSAPPRGRAAQPKKGSG